MISRRSQLGGGATLRDFSCFLRPFIGRYCLEISFSALKVTAYLAHLDELLDFFAKLQPEDEDHERPA